VGGYDDSEARKGTEELFRSTVYQKASGNHIQEKKPTQNWFAPAEREDQELSGSLTGKVKKIKVLSTVLIGGVARLNEEEGVLKGVKIADRPLRGEIPAEVRDGERRFTEIGRRGGFSEGCEKELTTSMCLTVNKGGEGTMGLRYERDRSESRE